MTKKIEELFGIDLRGLAIFRMALSLLLLADLFIRSFDLRAHYSDSGVLPRTLLLEQVSGVWDLSLHLASGVRLAQAGLFLTAAHFAVCLLVGVRTRLFAFLSWTMLLSLHNRNPWVLSHSDIFLRMLLFWGQFLPLGARYSVDSLRTPTQGEKTPRRILSSGTTALLTQVVFVYLFTVIHRTGPDWWKEGTAVYEVLSLDQLVTPFGRFLLHFPVLLKGLTYGIIWLETIGPFLLFVPFWTGVVRLAVVPLFLLMHIGFGLCLHLGTFPWVSSLAMIPFLPVRFWDKLLGGKKFFSEEAPPLTSSVFANFLAAFFLITVILWNLETVGKFHIPRRMIWLAHALRVDQTWNMFSPHVPRRDGWFVVQGKLREGKEIDPFQRGKPVTWEKPKDVALSYRNFRWRRTMMHLLREKETVLPYFGRYLCQEWNRKKGEERLEGMTLFYMVEETLPDRRVAPVEKVFLGRYSCDRMEETGK